MTSTIRKLVSGEEAIVEAFLASTPETTIFLRSNMSRAGLVDDGSPFTGTYAGAFEGARLVGVAASYWNTNVVVAPGPHAEAAAACAVALSGRNVGGILGPHDEVVRVRAALGHEQTEARFSSKEILYALALPELVVPEALIEGHVAARKPEPDEMGMLIDWRMAYAAETSHTPDTPEKRASQATYLATYQANGHHFIVTVAGDPVSYSAFNATVADVVQVGGVWTPPALRGRGYARCAVAASLQDARSRGVTRAVLFTDEKNLAAQRSYAAIGFQPVGHYGIVFFG